MLGNILCAPKPFNNIALFIQDRDGFGRGPARCTVSPQDPVLQMEDFLLTDAFFYPVIYQIQVIGMYIVRLSVCSGCVSIFQKTQAVKLTHLLPVRT